MAFTEIYVDPSIAADSGAGTIGDPYGDLEYAIEQETFDTTNGTRVNIKAGTDEVLTADLSTALADTSVSVAWAPGATAPLIFQGYNSTAGDGGVGGISGGGSVAVIASASLDYVSFIDLHLHNVGAVAVAQLDNDCNFIRCEIDNSTVGGINVQLDSYIQNCYIHNVAGTGILIISGVVEGNYITNGTNSVDNAIICTNVTFIERNIISIDGASNGIDLRNGSARNNSIYSNGGTGTGILIQGAKIIRNVTNNLVEGFSGAGGVGIDYTDPDMRIISYGANSIYNCTTEVDTTAGVVAKTWVADETLSASPFTNASAGDFSPVNTGSVKEGSRPASFYEG